MNNLKGLLVFSITSMLERFGFYAMMSILVLSFIEKRGFSPEEAGQHYSTFYFAMYVSMLFMGLVGDFVNRRKVIFFGMIAMAIGYFLYPIMSSGNEISLIIPGAFLIIGVGAFKTNLQVQVGDLYEKNVKNGAIGYLVFYSLINLGAIFAPFAAVYLKNKYGVDSVLLLSGAVTLLALSLYYFVPISRKMADESPEQIEAKTDSSFNTPAVTPLSELSDSASYGIEKIIGLVFLIFLVPILWMAFHQNGLIYIFYVRDFVNLNGNSPEVIQAVNPIAFVLLSIIGVAFIYFFAKMKQVHSIFPFIAIGMVIAAIGYFIPAYGLSNLSGKLPYSYAVIPMVIITLGEVFISPFLIIGFYHFSPARVRGLFMGLFMIATALGNTLLYKYAVDYQKHGAVYAFNKVVIHILICAASVLLVWYLIKKISDARK